MSDGRRRLWQEFVMSTVLVPLVLSISSALGLSPSEAEQARVRLHLRGAEQRVVTAGVGHLSPEQRAERQIQVERLRQYLEAGEFPKNREYPGKILPIFRDADGTLCAVGYLMWISGERELVDRIARRRNLATIHELADEPGVAEWLTRTGLSLEEAARIQPGYDFIRGEFTTPSHSVETGRCSPTVTLRMENDSGIGDGSAAYLSSNPRAEFFSDAACSARLPSPGEGYFETRFAGQTTTFHFRPTASGDHRIQVDVGMKTFFQTHSVSPATGSEAPKPADPDTDPVMAVGCAHVPAPLAGAAAVLIVALLRRRWRR